MRDKLMYLALQKYKIKIKFPNKNAFLCILDWKRICDDRRRFEKIGDIAGGNYVCCGREKILYTITPPPILNGNSLSKVNFFQRNRGMVPTLHKHTTYMRKEYQIRNEQQDILFRCDAWRTANAMLDRCPKGCFVFTDEFYDDEP